MPVAYMETVMEMRSLIPHVRNEVAAMSVNAVRQSIFETNGLLRFGDSVDFFRGELKGGGIDISDLSVTTAGNGLNQKILFEMVESRERLFESMSVNIEASGSYNGISASAAGEFAKTVKIDRFAVNVFLYILMEQQPKVLTKRLLTAEALALAQVDLGRFFERYGTHFVMGEQSGGEMFGLFSYAARTREEYQSITAKVSAGIQAFNASGSLNSTSVRQHFSDLKTTRSVVYINGAPNGTLASTLDKFLVAAEEFLGAMKNPSNHSMIAQYLMPFGSADNAPENLADFDGTKIMDNAMTVSRNYLRTLDEINNYNEVIDNPILFEGEPDTNRVVARERRDRVITASETMRDLYRRAIRGEEVRANIPPIEHCTFVLKPVPVPDPLPNPILMIYDDEYFGGGAWGINEDYPDFGILTGNNHMLSAFKLDGKPGQFTAIFYRHANYRDEMFRATSPDHCHSVNSRQRGANDQASSVRITRNF